MLTLFKRRIHTEAEGVEPTCRLRDDGLANRSLTIQAMLPNWWRLLQLSVPGFTDIVS
jgi:hypothetical protein